MLLIFSKITEREFIIADLQKEVYSRGCVFVCIYLYICTFFCILYQDDYLASMTFGSRTSEMFLPQPHVFLANTILPSVRPLLSYLYNPKSLVIRCLTLEAKIHFFFHYIKDVNSKYIYIYIYMERETYFLKIS